MLYDVANLKYLRLKTGPILTDSKPKNNLTLDVGNSNHTSRNGCW